MSLQGNQSKFKEWEEEVYRDYPREEYKGVFQSVAHAKLTLEYMKSKEGKKTIIKELGEAMYLEEIRKKEREISIRQAELMVLRESFK